MLTERQLLILQTIIDNFIDTAHPIGSRALSKDESIQLSSATIRNVMADLEDMALLEKTHSSSGRIPSEKGYRYYVDHLITPKMKQKELNIIKHVIQNKMVDFEQIVQLSADLLSQLTNYTTVILGPHDMDATLKQVQLVKISDTTAVAILVTNTGHVEHKSFTVPSTISMSELEKLMNILNDRLQNVPLVQLPYTLQSEVYALMEKHIHNYEVMYDYIQTVLTYDDSTKIYVGGQSNILMQPEFKDVEKIYDFYTMLENEQLMIDLLSKQSEGIQVSIGNENEYEAIKHFSLITSSYTLNDNQTGKIALIGPTRMEYRKVFSLMQALSNEISEIFYPYRNE